MPHKNPEDKRAYMRRWRAKNPNKYRKRETKYMREWRAKNREDWNKYQRERYKRSRGYFYHIKSKFNLTVDQYEGMVAQQGDLCAICKTKPADRYNVDHDHKTGKVRGLLCGRCNTGLGAFKDAPEILIAAAHYLTSCNNGSRTLPLPESSLEPNLSETP